MSSSGQPGTRETGAEFSEGSQICLKDLSISHNGKRLRGLGMFRLRREGSGRISSMYVSIRWESCDKMRANGHKLKSRKLHLNLRKSFFFFFYECGQTLERVAKRGCGSLSSEKFRTWLYMALSIQFWLNLLWAGGLDYMIWGRRQPQLFCDPVIFV